MKNLKVRKLRLNHETINVMRSADLQQVQGGVTIILATFRCTAGCQPTEGDRCWA